jgi:maltose/moltooligosaccharide transporter
VQPIIGHMSDRTWGRLGRRRPYFLTGAILSSLALIAMPNCSARWMAAGLLWILDASVNITMEPFRAFVGDLLPEEQRKSGFAMQSLLIGVGAVLSSAMPYMLTNWLHVQRERRQRPIPLSVRFVLHRRGGVLHVPCSMDDRDDEGVSAREPGGVREDEGGVGRSGPCLS